MEKLYNEIAEKTKIEWNKTPSLQIKHGGKEGNTTAFADDKASTKDWMAGCCSKNKMTDGIYAHTRTISR